MRVLWTLTLLTFVSCTHRAPAPAEQVQTPASQAVTLPAPFDTKSVHNFSKVLGWPKDKAPSAPSGLRVTRYAEGFINPRNLYVLANGDVLIAEANTEITGPKHFGAQLIGYAASERIGPSANRITLLRDADHDGVPEVRTTLLAGLNRPFGMLVVGDFLYVANTDALWRYPFHVGETSVHAEQGQKLLDLPALGYNNHWTRNLLASEDGKKIFITVGSGSNAGEHGVAHEQRRANVLEVNLDGTGEHVYASGLRNPVGIAYAPGTHVLWTAVNERDELGDELVPDYLTHLEDGAFFGFPYSYYGQHLDPRVKEQAPELVAKARVPDVPLGSHTASLGLAFAQGTMMPEHFRDGAFIGQHGSWNRTVLAGYQVAFVPFHDGKPTGPPEPFLTGFIANAESREVYGRPVGLAFLPDGSLLVADDAGNTVWRVSR